MARERRTYTEEFKLQMAQLVQNGKSQGEVCKEYEITSSVLSNWVKSYNNSGSFKKSDNLSELEKDNIRLRKELKQKEMEVDILKQAALIIGRK